MQPKSPGGPVQSAEWIAYEFLKNEILSGRLPGGSPVRQEAIAAQLGMSRIPVRDAIAHLVAGGLLAYESNRRVIVTVLKEADLVELFAMRAVLEGLAARHAIAKLGAGDFEQLSWLASRMDKTDRSGDQWVPIHHEFHDLLCRPAGMPRLFAEIHRLRQRVEPYVRMLISLDGAAELRTSRHNQLVNSIVRNRDPEHAEKVVREHIEQASRTIAATIRSSQEPAHAESRASSSRAKATRGDDGRTNRKALSQG
ncbi:MAG TPA: GntR family transcriptional regulator [Usitatibacter sp.]|jgi:DNA-binding GntR family transcriptional regulator|nr:GntR family transcriptional regulator [Usitatibacter sp.]